MNLSKGVVEIKDKKIYKFGKILVYWQLKLTMLPVTKENKRGGDRMGPRGTPAPRRERERKRETVDHHSCGKEWD